MSSATLGVLLTVRLETLEKRMGRVEDAINTLLSRFELPLIQKESVDTPQPALKPVTKSGPYIYKLLDISLSEIRILAVQNSIIEQDPIRCELAHMGPRKAALWLSRDINFPSRRISKLHFVQCVMPKARRYTLPDHQPATLVLVDRRNLHQSGRYPRG